MIKRFAIINKSTVVNNTDATNMAAACNLQIANHMAPAYNRLPIPVTFYTAENLVPAGSAKIYIFDNTDQAGALGYHDETMGGQVYGEIFAKTIIGYGLPIMYDPKHKGEITVSSVLSHEVCETFADMYVDLWADGTPISQGSEYAYESCDPVESNIYQISVTYSQNSQLANIFSLFNHGAVKNTTLVATVSVSNFVYPEYFDTASPTGTKLDYLGLVHTPFTMTSGGYLIVRQSGVVSELFGSSYPAYMKQYHGFVK